MRRWISTKWLHAHPWLRRALAIVLGAYLGYLLLANAFLSFHLLDRIVTSDDGTVEVRTGRAWSLWPGRASVRDFVLRLDGKDNQLRLTVARASTSISLWRLIRREVRLADVDAAGVSFRMRLRVAAIGPDNAERVAAFPEIEGALGPPLESAAKPTEPVPVEKQWHVDLVDARADVDEVWIEEYRLTGTTAVHGGFAMWPGKDLLLRPSGIATRGAALHVGTREVTGDLEATGDATITQISLADAGASTVLLALDASVRGSSMLQDASFLDLYPGVPHIRVKPSKSTFDVHFANGRFVQGTEARLEVPHGSLRTHGLGLSGAVVASVKVPQDGDLEFGADSDAGQLELDALPSTKAAPWTLHATSIRQILRAVVGDHTHLGLGAYRGELRTPTLGWFEDLVELGLKTHGRAASSFDLKRDGKGVIHGTWQARVEDGVISGGALEAGVSNKAHGELTTKPNPAEGVTVSSVVVEAPRASVRATGKAPHVTWFRADVPSVTVAMEPRLEVRAAADLSAGDGGLVAGVLEAEAGLVLGPIAAHFVDGPPMAVRVGVASVEKEVTVEVPSGQAGTVTARGFWRKHHERSLLALLLFHPPLSIGVRLGDGVPLVLPAATTEWLEQQKH